LTSSGRKPADWIASRRDAPGRALTTPSTRLHHNRERVGYGEAFDLLQMGLVAIAGGIALTAIEIVGAVSYLTSQSSPSYLVAGGALITAVAAIVPILAARCSQARRYFLALLLWGSMIPALSLVFSAAVERTGSARDEANRDRQVIAQKIELARSAERDAKAVADADEAKAVAECSRAAKGSPRGPLCTAAEGRADTSRQRLQTARDAVASAGVVSKDSQAVRLAAILPVSEESVALYQPIVLPVAISVLGLLLISAGAHQQPARPTKVVRKAKGKRKHKPRLSKGPQPSANVVPLRRRA
jgi:hypothetical protein